MFKKEIERYEKVRAEYENYIVKKMSANDYLEWNEVLFSCHSCAIEGNSFTLDDTRVLLEQGLSMVPVGRSLLECTEMSDHFRAFRYITSHLDAPFDEALLKETNRLVTENTLAFRVPDAVAGEYTTCDMAAGDTMFGDHKKLIARIPDLMESTNRAISSPVPRRKWTYRPTSLQLDNASCWASTRHHRHKRPSHLYQRSAKYSQRRYRRISNLILLCRSNKPIGK